MYFLKTDMADETARKHEEAEQGDPVGKIYLQRNEEITGPKSPPIYRICFEEADEIAKKLLECKFYLTALELHTELIEYGKKELPRLKEFFSNPANFEIQTRLDPLAVIKKTASNLTLDSIDDYGRYSDDGFHPTDEKITVLEFELRKAKETIHELRETITQMTSDRKDSALSESVSLNESCENQYEVRTLNFLVNSYLLKHEYKFTSITFSEEIGDQDLDDWEDVGLNAAQPPDLLNLLRDYSKHVVEPVKMRLREIEQLRNGINDLNMECEKLNEELQNEVNEKESLKQELTISQRVKSQKVQFLQYYEDDNLSNTSLLSNKSLDSLNNEESESSEPYIPDVDINDFSSTSIHTSVENDKECRINDFTDSVIQLANPIEISMENVRPETNSGSPHSNNSVQNNAMPTNENTKQVKPVDDIVNCLSLDVKRIGSDIQPVCLPSSPLLSRKMIDLIFSRVHVKGKSRLAHQVSKEGEAAPVEVIAKSLPNIVPNVLLNKREELIPLILCAASYHEDPKTRDELLHTLFNLIKKPDQEQRKVIIDGCVTFARKVGATRIESELLPQCWEQINHKFAERRLLVSETCGFVAPYIPNELSSSLILSMLSQMLQEDRSEEVRCSVVRSLALVTALMDDVTKYSKVYSLLDWGLKDIVETVVNDTKDFFLPVLSVWASTINKLQPHMITHILKMCKEALETWNVAYLTNTMQNESNAVLLTSEVNFNSYIDCLTRIVPVLYFDCLSSAPFYDDKLTDYEPTIEDGRFPPVNNPLYTISIMLGDEEKFHRLVNKFDDVFGNADAEDKVMWSNLQSVCDRCILEILEMTGLMFNNPQFIEKIVSLMCTIARVFGKNFTQSKIIPLFEKLMRNTGSTLSRDIPHVTSPVASPILTIFLCGVLSSFQGEELAKRLFTFTKQCLIQIATQGFPMTFISLSITLICQSDVYQLPLIETLRETIVYPVAEVRALTAALFETLVKCVNQQLLSTHVAPAIITLANDRDMVVRIAAMPALGTVMEVINDKSLLDKVCLQLQTVLDDPHCQKNIPLQKIIIQTFTKIIPGVESKFRDDFVLPRLKRIAECNNMEADVADRLDVAEELITAFSSALCCFLPREVILQLIIPTLKTLETDLKDFSPETVDSVLILQKEAESKCHEDKMSASSVTSTTTSSKLFSGISSKFKFKKKSS